MGVLTEQLPRAHPVSCGQLTWNFRRRRGGKVVVRRVVACRVVERCGVVERSRRVVSVQLISRSVDPRSQLRLLAVR